MWKSLSVKAITVLLLLVFCWLALYVGTFPLTKLTPWWGRMGYFDWPVFVEAATEFISSGILYYPDLERYAPNAEIYKFPPLFASLLIVLLRAGIEPEMLRMAIGSLQLLMYFASIWLCLRIAKVQASFFLCIGIFLFVATFEPFINNFIGLQLEAFILFLLCLMLWALASNKPLTAGFLLSLAVSLKLYPLFIIGIVICIDRRIRFLTGLVAGMFASLVFTTLVIGVDQSLLYFSRIAPTLATELMDTNLRNVSINNLVFQMGWLRSSAHYAGIALMLGTLATLFFAAKPPLQSRIFIAACSLLVAALVVGTKNSWGNYQLLLVLPVIILFAEATKTKAPDYISIVLIFMACGLIFFSPPHRLYFVVDKLFGLKEIPIVLCFVLLRSIAGLIILSLCLRFFLQIVLAKRVNGRAP